MKNEENHLPGTPATFPLALVRPDSSRKIPTLIQSLFKSSVFMSALLGFYVHGLIGDVVEMKWPQATLDVAVGIMYASVVYRKWRTLKSIEEIAAENTIFLPGPAFAAIKSGRTRAP